MARDYAGRYDGRVRASVIGTTGIAFLLVHAVPLRAQEGALKPIEGWITLNRPLADVRGSMSGVSAKTADGSSLLQKLSEPIPFRRGAGRGTSIVVDPEQRFQSMDGFGFALTGGSAELLLKMTAPARAEILRRIFVEGGVSYLRLTIGASDMNRTVYSYDDLPAGETDPTLSKFDLGQDRTAVLPALQEILGMAPGIKLLASPWSAPAWMKSNGLVRGGSLKPEFYDAYALYLVKYIQAMRAEGVSIDAITIQNEPLNGKNTPSMQWQLEQQLVFLRDHLAPAFAKAAVATRLVLFDHNLDRPDYPLALLADPVISRLADGTGFHHYGGEMSAMTLVHTARPDKNLYFTEQMIVERPSGAILDIAATVKRMLIDTTRNWARNVILWNLAADPQNGPHTDNGGCSMCQGAITIDGDAVSFNLAWHTIVHASKFVPPGSVRIASTARGEPAVSLTEDEERPGVKRVAVVEHAQVLPNVAFQTPEGRIVLIVANDTSSGASFGVQYKGQTASLRLASGAAGTYVW